MRTLLKFILVFLPVLAFSQAPLSQSDQKVFKENIAGFSQTIENLSSDFIQTKYLEMMENATVSKGKLYYKAPDVLKWEYSVPFDYKILFRGNQLYINDEGDKSVMSLQSNKMFEKLIGLISGSVNGKLLEDDENFHISYFRSGNEVAAVLIPKDQSLKDIFSEITLIFNQKYLVNKVKLKEDAGDYTEIKFNNIQVNKPIEKGVFEN